MAKSLNTVRSGMAAYMGIMAQVQAEREAAQAPLINAPLPHVPMAACWTPRGHEAFNKRGPVQVTYVTRLSPRMSRATFTYVL